MFSALATVLGAGLQLWGSKERTKYLDKLTRLKKEYYEEENSDEPDDARLDNLEFELRLMGEAFSAQVASQNSKN